MLGTMVTCSRHIHRGPDCRPRSVNLSLVVGTGKTKTLLMAVGKSITFMCLRVSPRRRTKAVHLEEQGTPLLLLQSG